MNNSTDENKAAGVSKPRGGNKAPKMTLEAVYDVLAYTKGTTAWEQFGYAPELVAAALKLAGKESCTLGEARAIVKAFAEREVM